MSSFQSFFCSNVKKFPQGFHILRLCRNDLWNFFIIRIFCTSAVWLLWLVISISYIQSQICIFSRIVNLACQLSVKTVAPHSKASTTLRKCKRDKHKIPIIKLQSSNEEIFDTDIQIANFSEGGGYLDHIP